MRFLDEKQALVEIKAMLARASKAKIAVAFWGKGAHKILGIGRAGLDIEIICNLDSGACNPDEIKSVIELLPNNRVFSDPRLHGKVYWTSDRAIVGSSNASTNGLSVEGAELGGWSEANILVEDKVVLKTIEKWFSLQLESSYHVRDTDLKLAKDVWDRRSRFAPPGTRLSDNLFQNYRSSPNHPSWTDLRLALWSEYIDKKGMQEVEALVAANRNLPSVGHYQGWRADLKSGQYLLDFNMGQKNPIFGGIYRVTELHSRTINVVQKKRQILLPGFPALKLTPSDITALKEVLREPLIYNPKKGTSKLVAFKNVMKKIDG